MEEIDIKIYLKKINKDYKRIPKKLSYSKKNQHKNVLSFFLYMV